MASSRAHLSCSLSITYWPACEAISASYCCADLFSYLCSLQYQLCANQTHYWYPTPDIGCWLYIVQLTHWYHQLIEFPHESIFVTWSVIRYLNWVQIKHICNSGFHWTLHIADDHSMHCSQINTYHLHMKKCLCTCTCRDSPIPHIVATITQDSH